MKKILLLVVIMFFMVVGTAVNATAGPCADNIAGVWYMEEKNDESTMAHTFTLVSDGTGFSDIENDSPLFKVKIIVTFNWRAEGDKFTMTDGTMVVVEFNTGKLINKDSSTEPVTHNCDHTGDTLTVRDKVYKRK